MPWITQQRQRAWSIPPGGSDRLPENGLRVFHLGIYYPPAPGDIESHVQTLARAQAKLGADVSVACVNHGNHSGTDVLSQPFVALASSLSPADYVDAVVSLFAEPHKLRELGHRAAQVYQTYFKLSRTIATLRTGRVNRQVAA